MMTATELWEKEWKALANERGCDPHEAMHLQRILSPNLYTAYEAECADRRRVMIANEDSRARERQHGSEWEKGVKERANKVRTLVNEQMVGGLDYTSAFNLVRHENADLFPEEPAPESNRRAMANDFFSTDTNGAIRRLLPVWALSALQINTETNDAQAAYLLSKADKTFSPEQGLRLAQEMTRGLMKNEQLDEPTAVARLKDLVPVVGRFFGARTTLSQ